MAKAGTRSSPSKPRRGLWILLAIITAVTALCFHYRAQALGFAQAATAYSARVACSCRFVAGRGMKDCAKDKPQGTELVTLVDDVEARSVTARFPLIASDTASYREGYGCVLKEWDD
ncbi:hypothetical protein [Altererythrobacter sp.]|uniref:hypothetical protein n=1 Tax=Altererythrobacter sp. TaxID=1872480 RepID=UPI003D1062CF